MKDVKMVNFEIVIDDDYINLKFLQNKKNKYVYEYNDSLIVMIELDDNQCSKVVLKECSGEFGGYELTIINEFTHAYNNLVIKGIESRDSGVEETLDEVVEPEIKVPYDPNAIKVTQARFTIRELIDLINGTEDDEPILDLSPDFQRNFVWDSTRKSRLIESILLKIPLPVFYLSRDEMGLYQVVDGVQRLTVIDDFLQNRFKLKNLEYLKDECEDKYYNLKEKDSIHPKFARALRTYQIDCNIIESETPYKVKLDIFKRLNTGGRSLNKQEIRNSIMKKEVREYVKKLAESTEFVKATDNSIKPKRMMNQELVMRFLGFYLNTIIYPNLKELKYNGSMDEFLDDIVKYLNMNFRKLPMDKIEKEFKLAMNNSYSAFGVYAFRKVLPDYRNQNKNMINKSLFTSFSIFFSSYSQEIVEKIGQVTDEFCEYLYDHDDFFDAVTYGTNDAKRVKTSFRKTQRFLEYNYGGGHDN